MTRQYRESHVQLPHSGIEVAFGKATLLLLYFKRYMFLCRAILQVAIRFQGIGGGLLVIWLLEVLLKPLRHYSPTPLTLSESVLLPRRNQRQRLASGNRKDANKYASYSSLSFHRALRPRYHCLSRLLVCWSPES